MMKLRNHLNVTGRRENWLNIAGRASNRGADAHNVRMPETFSITPKPRPKREIIVPVAFTPACEEAATLAIDMAERMDCGVLFVHVAERIYAESFLDSAERKSMRKRLVARSADRLKEFVPAKRKPLLPIRSIVRTGLPSYEILRLAESVNARWIVMGRTPRNILNRMVFGSVSREVIDLAACPVVLVNADDRRSRSRTTKIVGETMGV